MLLDANLFFISLKKCVNTRNRPVRQQRSVTHLSSSPAIFHKLLQSLLSLNRKSKRIPRLDLSRSIGILSGCGDVQLPHVTNVTFLTHKTLFSTLHPPASNFFVKPPRPEGRGFRVRKINILV
jgi:hypothetical protein